jgi:protein SCO1/2
MARNPTFLIAAAVGIVAIAGGMLLARSLMDTSSGARPAVVKATVLNPARPLPEISLIDQAGAEFDGSRLKNRWSLVFFGFTRCPDVCPTTLGTLAQVAKSLADLPAGQRPQIILVSVDPQRDTPEQLAPYVQFFDPSFTGLTGTQHAIDSLTRALGVPVGIRKTGDGDYTVDHSAAIFLIDPQGAMRALFSTPHESAVIADDYRRIVAAG